MSPHQLVDDLAKQYGATGPELRMRVRLTRRLVTIQGKVAERLRSLGWSWPEVGRALNRHHTTVMANLGLLRGHTVGKRIHVEQSASASLTPPE